MSSDDPDFGISLRGPAMVELLQAVLTRGAAFRFQASGNSMSPFIISGDILVISRLPTQGITLGQVVAYRNPMTGGLLVHRLVGSHALGYLFKGDNCSSLPCEAVAYDDILGLVVSVQRQGTYRRFGLGFERIIIALLSRYGLLVPLIQNLSHIKMLGH